MKTKLLRKARKRVQVQFFGFGKANIRIEGYRGEESRYIRYRGPINKLDDRINQYVLRAAREMTNEPTRYEKIKDGIKNCFSYYTLGDILEKLAMLFLALTIIACLAYLAYVAFNPELAEDWEYTPITPIYFFK